MNNNSMTSRPFFCALLTAVALCSAGAGCGQGDLDAYDSTIQGLTMRSVGPIGTSTGTMEGTGSNQQTPVKKIIAYTNGSYMYGMKLIWGVNNEKMYGSENDIEGEELDFENDSVKEIKYHVDANGYLRGLRFKTVGGSAYPVGYLNVTQVVAFSNPNAVFTDLVTYKGSISGTTTFWGATFHYTTP